MKKAIVAGLTGAVLAVAALSSAALAQAKPSVETTTVSELVANPAYKAVIEKDWPNFAQAPMDMIGGQTLKAISAFPQAGLDEEMLKKIQADLDAAAK